MQPVKHVKKQLPEALKQFQWKPGQSGNQKGRPRGQTMKEYIQKRFKVMTPKQKEEFLSYIPALEQWKMAEGGPSQTVELEEERYNPYANFTDDEIIEKIKQSINAYDEIKNNERRQQ